MSSLFGQVWFWSLLAFLIGAVLTWVLLVRPAQQRVQQLERQPRGNRPTPRTSPAQQAPPRPGQQSGPPRTAYQPPATPPAWPGQQGQEPDSAEHHPRTQWLERDSLAGASGQRTQTPDHLKDFEYRAQPEQVGQPPGQQQRQAPGQVGGQAPGQAGGQAPGQVGGQAPGQQERQAPGQVGGQAPDQQALHRQPAEAPEQPGGQQGPGQQDRQMPDQREFVRAEPPAPVTRYVRPEPQREPEQGYQREWEQQYPEEVEQESPQDYQREYPEDYQQDVPQDYPEDDVRADGGYGATTWQEERPAGPSGSGALDDIDEQPEFGDLDDVRTDSVGQRQGTADSAGQHQAAEQRPGSLFEPSAPEAEPEPGYDSDFESNGYVAEDQPAAATSGAHSAPDPAEADAPGAPDTDPVTGLPRRRRGASNRIRGGFAPPRPIEPSIRPVARRTPQQEGGVSSGSLFEPTPGEQSAGSVAQASGQPEAAEAPPGPFGPGSAMPLPGGGKPDPSFSVKASVTELRYCTEDSPQFAGMTPEVWFATPSDAERVGFRPLP